MPFAPEDPVQPTVVQASFELRAPDASEWFGVGANGSPKTAWLGGIWDVGGSAWAHRWAHRPSMPDTLESGEGRVS